MPTIITWRVLACILGLALGSFAAVAAPSQTVDWASFLGAGLKAAAEGHYDEAEKDLREALQEAEKSDPDGLRLPESLDALVGVYSNQGKYAQAEPLAIRLVAAREKTLGKEHPVIASLLDSLGQIYGAEGNICRGRATLTALACDPREGPRARPP